MLAKYDIDTFSPHIPDSSVKEIFNSVVRIRKDLKRATGFFLKIKIKDLELNSLITNYHVISQCDVDSMKKIYIYYDSKEKEITKQITLNSSERFIRCFPDPKDITVIEIKNYDYIPDYKFLTPDSDYKISYYIYYKEKFFLAGYPCVDDIHNGERHISSGRITQIYYNNIEFEHTIDTRNGSSGSPICLLKSGKVIGVNKAHRLNSPYGNLSINVGTFIGVIIDELEKEYYLLPKINNKYCNDYYSSYKSGLTHSRTRKFLDSNDEFSNKSVDAKISKIDLFEKISDQLNTLKTLINKKISKKKKTNFSLFEENDSFKNKDKYITKRSNNFIKKEKKINVNRNKTPISYNNSYYGFKESFTSNYTNYNYTTKENSLTRQANKSFEPKLKYKKKNKKKKNKDNYGINKNMNNITTYTNKYNQEGIKYSSNDQSLNYYRINMETREVQYRNNKNYSSYISKSYDNASKNITINNNNININISTINNNMTLYRNNYYYYYPNYNYVYMPTYYYMPIYFIK